MKYLKKQDFCVFWQQTVSITLNDVNCTGSLELPLARYAAQPRTEVFPGNLRCTKYFFKKIVVCEISII